LPVVVEVVETVEPDTGMLAVPVAVLSDKMVLPLTIVKQRMPDKAVLKVRLVLTRPLIAQMLPELRVPCKVDRQEQTVTVVLVAVDIGVVQVVVIVNQIQWLVVVVVRLSIIRHIFRPLNFIQVPGQHLATQVVHLGGLPGAPGKPVENRESRDW
jgi:hypothetical protein